ncbi:hypothetical protein ROZALSC1DRAFT_24892 [Rozella allomycis CSF55]|uniref:Uncharacterized protein n=1 Tax=Rozella allomycis (strain CSF55) TaxID=988480 RepID=A0A4P9YD40_ROZAC|nr:hypothetical protein ROZALSC1DRAFT_24892 [Rozella allomycis CSF55]
MISENDFVEWMKSQGFRDKFYAFVKENGLCFESIYSYTKEDLKSFLVDQWEALFLINSNGYQAPRKLEIGYRRWLLDIIEVDKLFNVFQSMESIDNDEDFVENIPVIHGLGSSLFIENLDVGSLNSEVKSHMDKQLHAILIDVSGAGKTRTIVDVARTRNVVYFDCNADYDFIKMKQTLKRHVLALVCSRLLVKDRLVETGKLKEDDYFKWLFYQRSRRSQDVFTKLYETLSAFDVSAIVKSYNGSFCFGFDEVQTLLESDDPLFNKFRSFVKVDPMVENGKLLHPRSFYTFLVNVFINGIYVPCMWSGTHFRLKDVSHYRMAAAGKPEALKLCTDFPFLDTGLIMNYVSRFWKMPSLGDDYGRLLIENYFFTFKAGPEYFFRFMELFAEPKKRDYINIVERIEQTFNPDFQYSLLPPEKAGPDFRYRLLLAYGKTTWTSRHVSDSESKANKASINYRSWYSSVDRFNKAVSELAAQEASKYFHLRFECPYHPSSVQSFGITTTLPDQSTSKQIHPH